MQPGHTPAEHRDPRARSRPPGAVARLAGLDVHHEIRGRAPDPAVVLLHHFHGSAATWRHVLTDLGRDHHVAAFDRPGFGLTERPDPRVGAGPYTRRTSVRITLELLDALDAEQGVLVGSSAGGTVALEAYALAPERVRALVLISPAITGDVGPPATVRPLLRTPPARRAGAALVRRLARGVTADRVTRAWHDPSRAGDDDVEAYRRPLRAPGWDRGLWAALTAEPPPRLAGLLPRIAVPTLVVAGASDRVIPPHLNARTAAAIPGARLEILPACGHTPQEECPTDLLRVVRGFLADI